MFQRMRAGMRVFFTLMGFFCSYEVNVASEFALAAQYRCLQYRSISSSECEPDMYSLCE